MLMSVSGTLMMTVAFGTVLAPGAPESAPKPPVAAVIHIKDFGYRPTPVTIMAGDRVALINDDDEAHTVTAADKTYDSGGLDTGGRFERVFPVPGSYYHCELHPYMKASIIVLAAKTGASAR